MKSKLLLVILSCITLISCKKETETENTTNNVTFKFIANGILVDISHTQTNEIWAGTGDTPSSTIRFYSLEGKSSSSVSSSSTEVSLAIWPSSSDQGRWLTEMAYLRLHPFTGFSAAKYNGVVYMGLKDGDFYKLAVTKIHDDFIDGTFSARLSSNENPIEKLDITEGEFKNLKIQYK